MYKSEMDEISLPNRNLEALNFNVSFYLLPNYLLSANGKFVMVGGPGQAGDRVREGAGLH